MKKNKILSVLICLLFALNMKAQDIHFSMYNAQPLHLNPALTGNNGCDYRAVLNYRMQWFSITDHNVYRTEAASFDMALGKRSNEGKSYGGVGLLMFGDQAGRNNLSTYSVQLSAAYHLMLNRRGTNSLSFGIQGGMGYRLFNRNGLVFDNQITYYGVIDPSLPSNENIQNDRIIYPDVNAGALWNFSPNKKTNIYIGGAVSHLNTPTYSFLGQQVREYMKYTAHGGGYFSLGKKAALLPSIMVLKQGPSLQLNAGTYLKYLLSDPYRNNESQKSIYLGAWYRSTDAVIAGVRYDQDKVSVGVSYDINISKLSPVSKFNGAPEIYLSYTGCSRKGNSRTSCPIF